MAGKIQWSPQQVELLKKLWEEGLTSADIGQKVGKNAASVRSYVRRNRKALKLKQRSEAHNLHLQPRGNKDFERLWSGSVPRGHWMITKAWGKTCTKT